MEFNSQICTTKAQSKRLLALGVKKETSDCQHWAYTKDSRGNSIPKRNQKWHTRIGTDESVMVCGLMNATFIPAWSLHRLLCITNPYLSINPFGNIEIGGKSFSDIYEGLISTIEYNIKEGYFNKEYLEEKK